MNWLLLGLLACSSGEKPKPKEEVKKEIKKEELAVQSSRSAPAQENLKELGWSQDKPIILAKNPDEDVPSSLAAQLGAKLEAWDGEDIKKWRGRAYFIYLKEPRKIPEMKGKVVFILDGKWSKEAIASLGWTGKSIIDISQTMALFASSEHLKDPQLKAGVVAWQIEERYALPRQRLDRDIPIALYGILATEKAGADHPNPHMRYFAGNSPDDSSMVVRLATARKSEDQAVLEKLAKDKDPWVRARAIDRVQNLEILSEGLSDPSSLVRVVSGHQLSNLAKEGEKEACIPLKDAARATDAYVRWKGAYGLGFCDALDDLVALLDDVDIDVQRQAAQSLRLQKRLPEAEDALKKKLESKNSFVRRWVLQSLTNIHTKKMETFLYKYLEESSSILERSIIQRALYLRGASYSHIKVEEYIPPKPPKDHKELEEILQSKDPTTLKDVAKFLVLKKRFHEQLYGLAKHEDSEIRKSAVEGLGWNGDPRVYQFLDDPDPDVVVTALDGIRRSRIGNGKGIEPLLKHPDAEIRYRAVQALGAVLGELSQKQRNLLSGFRADPDERIRAAVFMVYPKMMKSDESSDWVLWKISLSDSMVYRNGKDDMASLSIKGDADQKAWIRGIVETEDEFLHRIFSWNDEKDRPPSHRVLRPPLFREYGFPNRG